MTTGFAFDEVESAYDTLKAAAKHQALKVVINM